VLLRVYAQLQIVSGGADRKVIVWNTATGDIIRILSGHSRSVTCLDSGANHLVRYIKLSIYLPKHMVNAY
jgi:WD40 repeat protein